MFSVLALVYTAIIVVTLGLFAGGYALARRHWQGGMRVLMTVVFGCAFSCAAIGLFVGGCTLILYLQ